MVINFADPAVVAIMNRIAATETWLGGARLADIIPRLVGYGFNTTAGFSSSRGRILSYKINPAGKVMSSCSSVCMNGMIINYSQLKILVNKIIKALEAGPVVTDPQAALVPATEYIVFSKKLQCSQYFRKGTSLAEAVALFARRGIVVELDEVTLLDPTTMKEIKIKPVVTTTYVLE